MQITLNDGQTIEIADLDALDEAIEDAESMQTWEHDPPQPVLDAKLQAHWKEVHEKLLELKKQVNE